AGGVVVGVDAQDVLVFIEGVVIQAKLHGAVGLKQALFDLGDVFHVLRRQRRRPAVRIVEVAAEGDGALVAGHGKLGFFKQLARRGVVANLGLLTRDHDGAVGKLQVGQIAPVLNEGSVGQLIQGVLGGAV